MTVMYKRRTISLKYSGLPSCSIMSKRLGPTPEPNSLDSGSDYICYQGEPGNALNISMPQFPHLKMGIIIVAISPVLLPGKSHGWRTLVGAVHGVTKSRT